MARGDYGPEVQSAINESNKGKGETPTTRNEGGRGKPAQGAPIPRAENMDRPALHNVSQPIPRNLPNPANGPGPGAPPPDAHHVAAAASIAHAILAGRGMR